MFPYNSIDWIVTDGQPHPEFEGFIECTCLACGRPFALMLENLDPDLEKNRTSCPRKEDCGNISYLRLITPEAAPFKKRRAHLKLIYSRPVPGSS